MTGAHTSAQHILDRAAAHCGIDASDAVAIRNGAHAVFQLSSGVVARIGKPGSEDEARRELRISHWLNQSGIPAVQVDDALRQPILVDDRPVTWWKLIPDHCAATPAELGATLRRLHALAPPTAFELPHYQPFAGVPDRIVASHTLRDDNQTWLLDHYATLRRRFEQLSPSDALCVIHGDAWQGNLVVPRSGIPTFLDLDSVSLGHAEWDLIQLAVDYSDFNRITNEDYRAFVAAYGGHDMTTRPEFRTYADIQELRWTTFAISLSEHNPTTRDEARHRIACLQGLIPKPWTWRAL